MHKINGIYGPFFLQHKKVMLIFPDCAKISDHSAINAQKINAKENCENVNALSRKLHFL